MESQEEIYARIINQMPSQNPLVEGPNRYERVFAERERQENEALLTTLRAASQFDPAKSGEAQRFAKELDIPSDVAERNMDEVRARIQERLIERQRMMLQSPVLAAQFRNLEFAKIAHDQVENLSATEKAFKWFRDIPRDVSKGWEAGRLTSEMGLLGEKAQRGVITPDEQKRLSSIQGRMREIGGVGGIAQETSKILGQMSYTMPESIQYGQTVGLTAGAAALVAGQIGPQVVAPEEIFTVPAATIGGFFAGMTARQAEQSYRIEAGQSYLDMIQDGIDQNIARNVSTGVGLVNATLEVVGMGFVTAPIKRALIKEVTQEVSQALTKPTIAMAVKAFAKNYGAAYTGEVTTELLQEVSAIAGDEIARAYSKPELESKLSTDEGRKEIAQRLSDVFESVAKGMAILAIPGAGLNFRSDYKRAAEAKRQTQFFVDLTKAANESEVRKRNPDAYQSFIAAQAQDSGAENIYIDAREFDGVLKQAGVTEEQLAQILPDIAPLLAQAVQTGDDVIIPTAQYAARVAGTDIGNMLMQHARIDPDAMSAAEAVRFESNKQQILADATKILEEKVSLDENFVKSAKAVETQMYEQIRETGRYSDRNARDFAGFVRDFVVTQSAQMKNEDGSQMTPEQFYGRYMYKVQAANEPRTAQMFGQEAERFTAAGFEMGENLNNEERTIEARFYESILNNEDALIEQYLGDHGAVVDADAAKTLSPEYVANPALAAAVHEPSSYMAKAIYRRLLGRRTGQRVVLTAGGGGSGKSETLARLSASVDPDVVYDSTLSSIKSARARISEALEAGSKVVILYTNREVGLAFEGALGRKRVVPAVNIARAHVQAAQTIKALSKEYAGNPNVEIVIMNNNGALDEIAIGTVEDVPEYEYNEVVGGLYERAQQAASAGRISPEKLRAVTRGIDRGERQGVRQEAPGGIPGGPREGQRGIGPGPGVPEADGREGVIFRQSPAAAQVVTGRSIFQDIITTLSLTDQEVDSTAIEWMTGLPGNQAFKPPKIGGLADVVKFLHERRMESGLPVLNISKPEDRAHLAKLVASEALAAIRNAGNSLEWYDETVAKTLAMMGEKFPELNTDPNARNSFLLAMAISSQGLNPEDNLKFAMQQYANRVDSKFPVLGQGDSASAMAKNFQKANDLLQEMGPELFRRFLVTPFTVRELESAGLPVGGENMDTLVLGSAVFGPKIGFGFFSNLNGNFEPVTMDMWFMRTIGRLAGTLPAFDQVKFENQIKRFRTALNERGPNARGLYASQFDGDLVKAAKTDEAKLIELARLVKKAHERDFKVNRAKFDAKDRIKTELVAAADTILISLEKPKDVPSSGGERNLLRDVVSQVVDIVAQQYGSRVPPAALQALIWYPEQELYKAMGVKLRVTSQDYAGAARKLLEGEGFDGQRLDSAAQSGSAAVRPADGEAVTEGISSDDQRAGRARPLQADERTQFLVERNRRIVEEQRAAAARVNFEVAPDPNNIDLVERWRTLTQEQRLDISLRVANEIVPKVLKQLKFKGEVLPQTGSYLEDTNPSFAIRLDNGDAAQLSKVLGFVLSQDSMMAIASDEFAGSFKTSALRIAIGEKTTQEVEQIYNALRALTVDGKQPIGGQSTSGGVMTILLDSDTDAGALSTLVNNALSDAYAVTVHDVFAAFPEKQEYDYADPQSDPTGDEGVVRQRARDARAQATEALRRELGAAAAAAGEPTGAPDLLRQQGAIDRGGFDPSRLLTVLNETADTSTFLHETAHFFLTVYADMAARPDATEAMRQDMQTLLDWFGIQDLATWNAMSLEQQRQYHEQFAYNFEIYMFEGKAPNVRMQGLFDRFASFLRRIYQSIRDDLNALYKAENGRDLPILTGEVRQVMDRMLASEEQIKQAEQVRNMAPMFMDQQAANMDDAAWAAYQQMLQEARDAAVTDLTKASLRQMKWLQNARGRILKDLQAQAKGERERIRAEVEPEVAQRPVYRAIRWLKTGETTDPATGEQIKAEKGFRLNTAALAEMYPETMLARPDLAGLRGMTSKDGLHPDVIAEIFGFASGDQMVREILASPPQKQAVDALTDQRMMAENSDLVDPKAIELAVEQALHNEARARFVAVELRHLSKAVEPVRVMLQAAKLAAQSMLAGKKIVDIRPRDHSIAEGRAAKTAVDAMKAGKSAEAQQAKQAQLIQNQMAGEAVKIRQEIDKAIAYLRKVTRDSNRKRIGADAADQIDAMLGRFQIAPMSLREGAQRADLRAWIEAQREAGYEPDIAPELVEQAMMVDYRQLTVTQFRDLVSAVEQIEAVGRSQQTMITQAKQIAYEQARDEIVNSILQNGRGRKAVARTATEEMGRFAKLAQTLRGFYSEHLKAAAISRIMDGGKDNGPMWRYLVRTANDAGNRETKMRAEATKALVEILRPIEEGGPIGGKGRFFESIGRSLNRESVISIALNWGNDSNRQRVMGGEGWTEAQVIPILQSLTAAEWRAIQQVWDYLESYRPMIAEKERRLYGKEPKWIEPGAFTVQAADGTRLDLRGGYYPVKFDPMASERAEQFALADEAQRQLRGAYTTATTRRSFTKERVEAVEGRPLLYSLGVLYSGINDVIHDLSWHEWLIDANKLMRSSSIDAAIRETYGPEFKRQLKTWIEDVAVGERGASSFGERAAGWIRQSVSAAGLGFNFWSAAQQVTGFASSIPRVGVRWIGHGIGRFVANPNAAIRMATEKSEFMAARSRTQFRELNELRNQLRGQSKAAKAMQAGTYFMMMRMQRLVDVPTWIGAYEKAVADGNIDMRDDGTVDDATAVALADQAVIDSQGSGMVKDLAKIERGGQLQKLFTVFYSYMNTQFNLAVTMGMTETSKGKLTAKYAMLLLAPVILSYALKKALVPGADDDEWDWEKISRELAAEQIQYLLGMMVYLRELGFAGKVLTGAEGPARSYEGPAGLRMLVDASRFMTQASQMEFDTAFRKSAINLLGDFTGLPSAQINKTITGLEALIEGETESPAAVVFGVQQ